jgi:hypothetical protein
LSEGIFDLLWTTRKASLGVPLSVDGFSELLLKNSIIVQVIRMKFLGIFWQ